MRRFLHIRSKTARFREDSSGAALVEFAILLPIMLLLFSVTIEGGRLMYGYQTTISGVRDAARYLARVTPVDICATSGSPTTATAIPGQVTNVTNIVRNSYTSGNGLFGTGMSITGVSPAYYCVTGTYRGSPVGIAQVTASITINFPFSGVMTLAGQTMGTVNTTVSDQSRIFGT